MSFQVNTQTSLTVRKTAVKSFEIFHWRGKNMGSDGWDPVTSAVLIVSFQLSQTRDDDRLFFCCGRKTLAERFKRSSEGWDWLE